MQIGVPVVTQRDTTGRERSGEVSIVQCILRFIDKHVGDGVGREADEERTEDDEYEFCEAEVAFGCVHCKTCLFPYVNPYESIAYYYYCNRNDETDYEQELLRRTTADVRQYGARKSRFLESESAPYAQ